MDNSNKEPLPLVIRTVWYDEQTPKEVKIKSFYINWDWLSKHMDHDGLYSYLETEVKKKKEQLEKKYGGVE